VARCAGAYGVVGVLAITGALGSAREANSLGHAFAVFGSMILIIGATAAVATFLANKWRGWLIVAPLILCLGLPIVLLAAFWIDMEKGEVHRRQFEEEVRSGRWDFGDQRTGGHAKTPRDALDKWPRSGQAELGVPKAVFDLRGSRQSDSNRRPADYNGGKRVCHTRLTRNWSSRLRPAPSRP
jgi:hypothetical protein